MDQYAQVYIKLNVGNSTLNSAKCIVSQSIVLHFSSKICSYLYLHAQNIGHFGWTKSIWMVEMTRRALITSYDSCCNVHRSIFDESGHVRALIWVNCWWISVKNMLFWVHVTWKTRKNSGLTHLSAPTHGPITSICNIIVVQNSTFNSAKCIVSQTLLFLRWIYIFVNTVLRGCRKILTKKWQWTLGKVIFSKILF